MSRRDDPQPQDPDAGQMVQEDAEYTLTGTGDPLDSGYVPPDRPLEERNRELDDRLARELPEDASATDPERAGRLEPDEGDDTAARDVGVDGGAASAEEAAVHRTGGDGDALEPVVDDSPMEDPEVAEQLDSDPRAEQAERDASRDAEGDPVAGRDAEHRGEPLDDRAAGIDAHPDAGGAVAPASGRDDVGTEGRLR